MRELFYLPDSPYFLSHSVGCLPRGAEKSVNEHLFSPWKKQGGDAWPIWLDTIEQFTNELSLLLGGEASQYCPQSNLSSGLTKFLGALPKPLPNKNKILIHADAFPSIGFVVEQFTRMGYELKLIEEHHLASDVDNWRLAVSEDVAGVVITHVHSNTGCVSPVSPIIEMAKANNSFSVVDIAQSAGVLPVDVSSWNADIVLGSCVKWLCGGPGAGFMWVNPWIVENLKPIDVGWFSHSNPFEMDIQHFCYHPNAKRFWGGTPSVVPYAIALGGVRLINNIGVDSIYKHNRALMALLLLNAPLQTKGSANINNRGGTLCINFSETQLSSIESALNNAQIFYDRRNNRLRFSFHIFNTKDEVEQLQNILWDNK